MLNQQVFFKSFGLQNMQKQHVHAEASISHCEKKKKSTAFHSDHTLDITNWCHWVLKDVIFTWKEFTSVQSRTKFKEFQWCCCMIISSLNHEPYNPDQTSATTGTRRHILHLQRDSRAPEPHMTIPGSLLTTTGSYADPIKEKVKIRLLDVFLEV